MNHDKFTACVLCNSSVALWCPVRVQYSVSRAGHEHRQYSGHIFSCGIHAYGNDEARCDFGVAHYGQRQLPELGVSTWLFILTVNSEYTGIDFDLISELVYDHTWSNRRTRN